MHSDYKIEEYKFAKEKIRKNEERRYQMIILCISAFGVIFGFIEKIPEVIIPIALLLILLICVILYQGQTQRQLFTSAYIIAEFENKIEDINYETVLLNLEKHKRESIKGRYLLRYFNLIYNPFTILTLISIVSFIYYGYDFFSTHKSELTFLNVCLYIIINLIGYFSIGFNIIRSSLRGVDYYLNKLDKMK